MGKKCSSVTDKQAEEVRKRIARKLKLLHIGVGDLSNIEIEAAMTRLATEKNLTDEVLYSPAHKQDIIDAIAAARRQKAKETHNPYDKEGTAQAIFDVISTYPLDELKQKHFYNL